MMKIFRKVWFSSVLFIIAAGFVASAVFAADESTKQILKQGLLGAGVGAISAGSSGGKAGQGALIGAGTGILGNVLLNAMTGDSHSGSKKRRRRQRQQQQQQVDDYYYDESDDYYYEEPPRQQSGTQKVLKQGLLGAGVGAISAGASGGKAGQGALIGAGTNVIGGALLDTITEPPKKRRRRRRLPAKSKQSYSQESEAVTGDTSRKKVIKKYDESGKLVSEEEIYY